MSEPRLYYSERLGRGPKAQPLPLDALERLTFSVWDKLDEDGYFQEAFGYQCVDAGPVAGTLGPDPEAYFLRTIFREGIWPYELYGERWDADTFFDVVEVLHDLVSRPTQGYHHDYSHCGWHYHQFDRNQGKPNTATR